MSDPNWIEPQTPFDTLAERGTAFLTRVIAIDSQSDEASPSIPSTEGQRHLSDDLQRFFGELGYESTQDDSSNLIVTIESNLESHVSGAAADATPTLALMVHMDTAEGTLAVPELCVTPSWDGGRVVYPEGPGLNVTAEEYDETRYYVGEDVLHGPGAAPIGLDDKLGMSELMLLAWLLEQHPEIPHGTILLVFRPDEEIGRMEAVESLADALAARGVTRGYTVDGLSPFEVNVANFNASRASVTVTGQPVPAAGADLAVRVVGVKSHGATARAEGYLNATTVLTRAWPHLQAAGIRVIGFESDPLAETNADVIFRLPDAAAATTALEILDAELSPHARRGAHFRACDPEAAQADADDAVEQLLTYLTAFFAAEGPTPVLSEDSAGHDGYSNPHFITRGEQGTTLLFRLRDFDLDALEAREQHVLRVAEQSGLAPVDVQRQYINMGPALAAYPDLVEWATRAADALGVEVIRQPIRGGTGVDPFLKRGIPIANVGTGYFAPESEKELTSKQNIARHGLWLTYLVQAVISNRA